MTAQRSGLTILQVLSWLNYGGVESYAIRLARGLKQQGHRVIVASHRGQLVPELVASGIEHVHIDFAGGLMMPGVWALRKLLEKEHVDLVNAHNWRAGAVSYLACRRAGVPYVLTIHGTRSPVNKYTVFYWSRRVAVVSEASRRNLVEGFGLPSERVVKTIIGVDCSRFHPAPPDEALLRQLGLRTGAPRVIHVSRFSHSKAPVAIAAIEAMEALERAVPGTELVVVGQGPEERAVALAAERMNAKLGRKAVFALGGRGDIPRILALGDAVIGTASVALEAMACAKPVVAAGKGGYFGIVKPGNLDEADASCFADHVEVAPVTASALGKDLAALLTDPAGSRALGEFGRSQAESRYSVARLTADAEALYREEMSDRSRVGRVVVFHLNQIGDLMFTLPALKAIREAYPAAHVTSVVRPYLAGLLAQSGLVDEVHQRPQGPLHTALGLGMELRRQEPDLAVAFSQSATMALCARISGARHRVGYLDTHFARLLTHRVQVRGIPCPEKVLRLVRGLGLDPLKQDYVGLVRLSGEDWEYGDRLLAEAGLVGDGPLIALAPGESSGRPYKSWTTVGFTEVAHRLQRDELARLLVVGSEGDRALGYEILAPVPPRQRANLAGRTTPSQLAAVLARCDLLIGIDSGPMHVAAAMGKPVVALFGPTDPRRTGPQGEGHEVIFHQQDCWRPCVHPVTPDCGHRNCMMAITPEEVLAAALRVLARQASSAPSAG
ncbi:MAG: glycosyltransferase family 9 protein [Armatimonadota bacterium]